MNARTLSLVLLAPLAFSACGDGVTGPAPPERWRLVQLVNQPVPGAWIRTSSGERVLVADGILELLENGRYVDAILVCNEGCREIVHEGRYERGGGEVMFTPDGAANGSTATVEDDVLTWGVSVYVRLE